MAKIPRVHQKQFGENATSVQLGVFGSLAAGTPTTGGTPTTIQSLSQFLDGWFAAVLGENSPAIEDTNSLFFLLFYQLTYLFQEGVPEWNTTATYFIGSLAQDGTGVIYRSKTDNNTGNALTDTTNWGVSGTFIATKTSTYNVLLTDDYVRGDPSAASFTATLPAIATVSLGKKYIFKNVATNGNQFTIAGNGAELIDQANTIILDSNPVNDSVTLINGNGVKWDII